MSEENSQEQSAAIEKEARLAGWVPQEEFHGKNWVDAETFVERGKEINGYLRRDKELLLQRLKESEAEIANVKHIAKEMEKFQKQQTENKVKELEAKLASLKEQKKEAISNSDGEAVLKIDDEIDTLKEEVKETKTAEKKPNTPQVELDPVIVGWMGKNEWFGVDPELTQMTDIIGKRINRTNPELRGQAFFDKLDEELRDRFPEQFGGNTLRSPVEGGKRSGGTGTKTERTFDALPDDAKAAFKQLQKEGVKITKEQYVDYYAWD